MRQREAVEYWALGSVLLVVELTTAKRAGLSVGALRVLVRLAALSSSGAQVRSVDVATFAGHADGSRDSAHLRRMRRAGGWVSLTGGANGTGVYALTPRGTEVCKEYARAWRRAVGQVERFEPVEPWRRVSPLKT